ncbi:MAG: adenosylmethionine--8-amino-7-oxononanoate transaminase [Fibrobacterota bacterium]
MKARVMESVPRDLRHLWHPCSQMKDYAETPPVKIVRGRGVHLYDATGQCYIDGISSWWVNLFGHANPRLNRVLARQSRTLEHVLFAGFTHEPAVAYAEALVRVAPPGLTKVFFADNGSSAVEAALKMSYQYAVQKAGKKRPLFIALSGGYHGETVGALSVGGLPLYRTVYSGMLMPVRFAAAPACLSCPYGKTPVSCDAECLSSLKILLRKTGADRVAGIIVEPLVQCANRMNMYPPVYLKKLRALCDRARVHLIADEIAVGFGRTGRLFACEHAGISPDLLCLSKGITGGYMPFSAVLATQDIFDAFYGDWHSGRAFLHSHSYTGNPLAAALALEVLHIFRGERILAKMKPRITQMGERLRALSRHPFVSGIRQTGLIGAFDLVCDKESGQPFASRLRAGRVVCRAALTHGALLRPLGDTIYFMPPLVVSEREMDRLFDAAVKALGALGTGRARGRGDQVQK